MKRAITVEQMLKSKFPVMPFSGKWQDSLGQPERSGVWLIWGQSANGKTRFAMQLARYLTQFARVAYDTLEEGARRSFQLAVIEERMHEVSRRFLILDRETPDELRERLSKQKSPDIVIIDSFQYAGMTWNEYKKLKEDFANKLFIFISHADGRNPEGRTAKKVKYDADVKIFVQGYRAEIASRYGGGKHYIIWEEGAQKFWDENISN